MLVWRSGVVPLPVVERHYAVAGGLTVVLQRYRGWGSAWTTWVARAELAYQ